MRSRSHRGGWIAGALIALFALGAAAQVKTVPATRAQLEFSYAPVVKKVAPAVVNIYARKFLKQPTSPLWTDPFFRKFFGEKFFQGQRRNRIQNSLGSGVIVDPKGLIVTNNHVVKGADEITVVLADRNEYIATLVQTDERSDLAVLKIDPGKRRLPWLELRDADELEVGDIVLAIGNPFGVGQTVTSGIVSALARTSIGVSDFRSFIQTDAAINPGNSGGALVTMDGRLVGINTAIYSRSGGSVGIGFAVPSNMVKAVLAAARGGKLVRPWLGASGQDVSPDIAASLGLDRPQGVLVNSLYSGGPAARGGLRVGDIVLAIDGHEIADGQELRFRIATLPVGGSVTLTVRRKGAVRRIAVALEAPPEIPPRNTATLAGRSPVAGAMVANLSPALAEEVGFDPTRTGVIVIGVRRGSRAHRFRLVSGDLIVQVNGVKIASVAALQAALAAGAREWDLILERRGRPIRIRVRG